ncbi:hypothetical protein [Paenibacillus sp. FJAT-26967]|uniref:hypothetical protein n=1 Tax=Paenibacillus sp. FJAT-26967 TaxID=1729690 RepID=UPI0008397151|nr:hypothetical protein [Paenibacillus sp. FJAT-26967]
MELNMAGSRDEIPIGLIGPEELLDKLLEAVKAFPSFRPLPLVWRGEGHDVAQTLQIMEQAEVLLFTDPITFKWAKKKIMFRIPVHYVPLTGTGLYRALYFARSGGAPVCLTVDGLNEPAAAKALRELGESSMEVVCYNGPSDDPVPDLVKFHREAAQKPGTIALTGMKAVYDELTAAGLRTEWLSPTEHDMTLSLQRALLSTETRRSKEGQIVIGFINIDGFQRLTERSGSEHEVQRMKLDLHRMVLDYVEHLDGYMNTLGGDEFLFMTTRGIFERETGGYKSIPLARDISAMHDLTMSIGIGFGRSANEAGTHARLALRRAKEAGGNITFIVREDRSVIGPLEMTEPNRFDLSLIDAELIGEASRAGMTPAYLSRLVAYVTRFGKLDYTAQELSSVLDVTVRSTHRFLLAWQDAGLVDVIGEERGVSKGRPKQIFRLSFLEERLRT